MKFARIAGLVVLASMFLSACNIGILPSDPFEDAIDATATADPFVPAASGTVGGHETIAYRVDISSTRNRDVVYLELDQNLDLTVYRSNGSVFASSESADRFASGLAGLGLSPQAIGVEVFCRGSCVIANATADSVFVTVANPGASPRNFTLYAYGDAYADTNEPANDSPAGAPLLTASDGGAIETLGDVDYFEMGANGRVTFTTSGTTPLRIQATIEAVPIQLTNGQSYDAVAGDIVKVEVAGGTEAGASAVSQYTLSYTP